jgi:hypothetical protein
MGIVQKILRLFIGSTPGIKIHSEFGDVIFRTTKELEKVSDKSIRSLMVSWCVSLPWAYFENLFINDNKYNQPLLSVFDSAEVINGTDCALITQAFILYHLEQLIKNDVNYKKFSMKEVEQLLFSHISRGTFLVEKLNTFRQRLRELPPYDWYFEYIREILNAIYGEKERTFNMWFALSTDSRLRLWLDVISIEMVKKIKQAEAKELFDRSFFETFS